MIPASHPDQPAAGFVLAGGQSSRMGADKALVLFRGRPLLAIALTTLREAGFSARIAGSRSHPAGFAPTIPETTPEPIPEPIPDAFPDKGPLGGIHAALSASTAVWNLFLPVDLPLMPASLLACLLRRALHTGAPVTAVRLNGRLEPFPVILHRCVLPLIEQRLRAGNTACHAAWQAMPAELAAQLASQLDAQLDAPAVESLVQCRHARHPASLPPALWFHSANTPADLALLHRIATAFAFPADTLKA